MLEELSCSGLVGYRPFQFRVFSNGRIQRDVQLIRNHLGNAIGIAITPTQYPANVAHDAFRFKLAKRDDLRDSALTVFLTDVFQDFPAARFAEIHVDVRGRNAIRI